MRTGPLYRSPGRKVPKHEAPSTLGGPARSRSSSKEEQVGEAALMPHAAFMAIFSSLSSQGPFPQQASKYTVRVPLLTSLLCKRTQLEAPQWTLWGPGFMARDHGSVEVAQTLPKHPPCCQHCTSTGATKLLNCVRDPPSPSRYHSC